MCLDCPSKRNRPLRYVCNVSLQVGIGSCRRPIDPCQNSFLWHSMPQPQNISAVSYIMHDTSAFLQPTLCPHFFSASDWKIIGLQAVCLCSLFAAPVVPGKHNQKEQGLCSHKMHAKGLIFSNTKSQSCHHSQLRHPPLSLQFQWMLYRTHARTLIVAIYPGDIH